MPPTHSASRISLSVPGLPHDLNVLKFDGHEAISRPYRFVIDVVSRQAVHAHRATVELLNHRQQQAQAGTIGILNRRLTFGHHGANGCRRGVENIDLALAGFGG